MCSLVCLLQVSSCVTACHSCSFWPPKLWLKILTNFRKLVDVLRNLFAFWVSGIHLSQHNNPSSRYMFNQASTAAWKAGVRPVAISNSVMAPMASAAKRWLFPHEKPEAPVAFFLESRKFPQKTWGETWEFWICFFVTKLLVHPR